MSTFALSIVTPDENKNLSITSLAGDTESGRFVVLEGHEPSVFALRDGLVILVLEDKSSRRFFIEGAVLRVQAAGCVLVVERILDIAEVTVEFLKSHCDPELVARVIKQMEG